MFRGAILAAGLLAVVATAASAETTFTGIFKVTAVTGCPNGPNVGDGAVAQFHPFFVGQSDHSEGLSIQYQFGGDSYKLQNQIWDTTFRIAESGGLGWGGVYIRNNTEWAYVRLAYRSPATFNTTTPRAILIGQIKRPGGNDNGGLNCIVNFETDLLKHQ